jgi:predicted RNA methylase
MNLDSIAWLQTAEAQQLSPLVHTDQHLASMTRLRARTTTERAAALYELLAVRQKAVTKFHDGHQLWFTSDGLEQASHERVAQHRASQFAGAQHIVDLCCGCGGDLLALATQAPSIGVDSDPVRIALAQANVAHRQLESRVQTVVADVTTFPLAEHVDAVFFDPGRRHQGRRIMDHTAYQPPLSTAQRWLAPHRTVAIKCAPGIDYHDVPFTTTVAVECVSFAGEMRETVLWMNAHRPWQRQATLISEQQVVTINDHVSPGPVVLSPPLQYLYEPDSAVIRAGLVQHLAHTLGAHFLDAQIAYLTHTTPVATPFARCWRIIDVVPFSERAIRARLAALGAGPVTVKKRGSAVDSDALARRLSRPHGHPYVVVLTRVADQHTAIICQGPISTQGALP